MNLKKIVVLILFLNFIKTYSQNWHYESGTDSFDGNYRTSYVIGKGDFPYNTPELCINVYNEKDLNFYISSSGYYPTENDIKVMLQFNNEPNIIYTSNFVSLSKDKETIFLVSFKNELDSTYNKHQIIKKLKKGSSLNLRIVTDFGDKNIYFSLKNSSKSIDFIYSNKYLTYLEQQENEQIKIAKERKKISDSINNIFEQIKIKNQNRENLLLEVITKSGVEKSEINKALDILKYQLNNNHLNIYEIRQIDLYINTFGILAYKMYNAEKKIIDSISVQLPETFRKVRDKQKL